MLPLSTYSVARWRLFFMRKEKCSELREESQINQSRAAATGEALRRSA